MPSKIPAPPAGFEIIDSSDGAPPPPPGFDLVGADTGTATNRPSFIDRFLRLNSSVRTVRGAAADKSPQQQSQSTPTRYRPDNEQALADLPIADRIDTPNVYETVAKPKVQMGTSLLGVLGKINAPGPSQSVRAASVPADTDVADTKPVLFTDATSTRRAIQNAMTPIVLADNPPVPHEAVIQQAPHSDPYWDRTFVGRLKTLVWGGREGETPLSKAGRSIPLLRSLGAGENADIGAPSFTEPLVRLAPARVDGVSALDNPVMRGGTKFAGGMTSASNLLMLKGLGLLKNPAVQTAISTYFSADMLANALSSVPEIQRKIEAGDWSGATELATESGLNAIFGYLSGRHALESGRSMTRRPGEISPEEARSLVSQPLPDQVANQNARQGLSVVDQLAGRETPTLSTIVGLAERMAQAKRGELPPEGFTVVDDSASVPDEHGATQKSIVQPVGSAETESHNVTAETRNKGTAGRQWAKTGSEFLADLEAQHNNAEHVPSLDNLIQQAGFVGRGRWNGLEGVYLIDAPDGTTRAMRIEDMTSVDAIRQHMDSSPQSLPPQDASHRFTLGPVAQGPAGRLEHPILDANGNEVGVIQFTKNGGVANVDWVGDRSQSNDLSGKLGTTAARNLERQFAAAHPDVERIGGIRIGGANGEAVKSVSHTLAARGASPETIRAVGKFHQDAQGLLAETAQTGDTSPREIGRPASDNGEVPTDESPGAEGLRSGSAVTGEGRGDLTSAEPAVSRAPEERGKGAVSSPLPALRRRKTGSTEPAAPSETTSPIPALRKKAANQPQVTLGKEYGTVNGNRFRRVTVNGDTFDVKVREGRDGSHETRAAEIKKTAIEQWRARGGDSAQRPQLPAAPTSEVPVVNGPSASASSPLPALRRASKRRTAVPAKTSTPPGPGAMNAQSSVENEPGVSNIAQLTEAINRMDPKASDPRKAVGIGQRVAESLSTGRDKVSAAWERVKGTAAGLWAAYRHPGEWTDYKDLTGKWQAAEQISDWELQRFADSIKTAIADKARREAISNYIEADGNIGLLRQRAEATHDAKLRRGYELAQKLTSEERLLADNIRNFQDSELQESIKAGVLEAGVENYVEHIWSKTPDHGKRIMAEVNFGALKTDPEFAKRRVYGTYFEGEQKGAVPLDKDIAFLVAAHHKAFAKALASRAYIKSLLEGKASDGRPLAVVSGGGQPIGQGRVERFPITGIRAGENDASAYIIRPKSKPLTPEAQKESNRLRREMNGIEAQLKLSDSSKEKAELALRRDAIQGRLQELREGEQYNTGDYRVVNHPALRKWKVATVDENGKPILVQSDIIVHPEVLQKVQNNLGTSALRRFEIKVAGRTVHPIAGLMRVSSEFKQTMLSLSAFHQTTVGVHALEHRTNPFKPVDLNLNDPKQRALVEHGLMVANFDAMAEFSEGLSTSGGLVAKVPGIGPKMQAYTQYLFRSYIPRLKMSMALHAAERNFERYGDKLTADQIYEMTANQANAAFGELNYKMMGRSKTTQDVLRLTLLAPDFLEARGRFVGQALKPYGREQLEALALGAGVMYAGGRILNQMLDDDPHWDRPFSLVVKGREYQMRTVQGDVWHLVGDPRGFVFNRLNPMTTRVAVEAVTGRDSQGRKRDFEQQLADVAKQIVPIPGQSFINTQGENWGHKLLKVGLQSVGVNEKKFRSKAEQLAHKYYIETLPANLKEKEHSPDYAKFRRAISDDELDRKEVEEAYRRGRITADERARILRDSNTPQLVREFGRLGKEEKLEVRNAMTDAERRRVRWTPPPNPKRSAIPPWLRGKR